MNDQATVTDLACQLKDFKGLEEHDYGLVYRKSDYDKGLENDELLVDVVKAEDDFVDEVKKKHILDNGLAINCRFNLCLLTYI